MEEIKTPNTIYGGVLKVVLSPERIKEEFQKRFWVQRPSAMSKIREYVSLQDPQLSYQLRGLTARDPRIAQIYLRTDPPRFIHVSVVETNYFGTWLVRSDGRGYLGIDAVLAQAMMDLDPRWKLVAKACHAGELLLVRLLTSSEVQALQHGLFPATLAKIGRPGSSFQPGRVPEPPRETQPHRPGERPIRDFLMAMVADTARDQPGGPPHTERRPGNPGRDNDEEDDRPRPKKTTAKQTS